MKVQFNCLNPVAIQGMAQRPDEDTEPSVQRLFIGPYRETGMGSQDLASGGLCVIQICLSKTNKDLFKYQFSSQLLRVFWR